MSELDRYRGAIAEILSNAEATITLGRGILVSSKGYVLTCWHVVQPGREIF